MNVSVAVRMAAASADSASSDAEYMERLASSTQLFWDGWREAASAVAFDFPGKYAIAQFHGSVRCLGQKIRELWISSRVRSPTILIKDLWCVTTSKSLQPWVKYLYCSRPHATASASPSTGTYRSSAPLKIRDPTKVIASIIAAARNAG